jgi:predicted transcriptional regulator
MVKQPISNLSLDELLPDSLTSTLCVNIEKGTKIWVVTGMLVQYLESFTDTVVVRDKDKPVGIVGGKHVIQKLVDNPTSDLFDNTNVEDIMTTKFIKISKRTKLRELLDFWKQTRIAFAIIPNEFSDYSELSARKLLEIGMRCKTDVSVCDLPEKKLVTFTKDFTIGNIINSMLEHGTRRLLLEGTTKFINDRIILEKIAGDLKYLRGTDNFLNIPVSDFPFGEAKEISEDLPISEVSKLLYKMEHPYIVYGKRVVSPWDICLCLLSDKLTEYE